MRLGSDRPGKRSGPVGAIRQRLDSKSRGALEYSIIVAGHRVDPAPMQYIAAGFHGCNHGANIPATNGHARSHHL